LNGGLKSFRCSLLYFVDDFVFGTNFTPVGGNSSKIWIGITPITPKLVDLAS